MTEITLEKMHSLLERLAEHVMNHVPTKHEMDEKISNIDEKTEKLTKYVITELPTKKEVDEKIQKVDELANM